MFRNLVSTIFLGLLLFSLFYNTVVWVRYELNVEEITELFCINKDKPELQCFGKCYVSGELIDFNLLPASPEPPVNVVSYVPVLKIFDIKQHVKVDFSIESTSDKSPGMFCYCFWESNYPEPLYTPPQPAV